MPNTQPFFSIILPTRNNANYLSGAIATVVNQDFDDYELIVSNNFSDDNTEEVALSFDSNKIKYVKTDKTLYYDDSWNYALSHATGKYILMIGDDDGVMKDGLKKLKSEIIKQNYPDLISQPIVRYMIDGENGNNISFTVLPYQKVNDAKIGFEVFLNGNSMIDAPLHTVIKREKIKKNNFYSKPYPDYSAFLKILFWSDSIYYSDTYAVIHGYTKKSAGGVFALTDIVKLRKISLEQQGMKGNVPLDLYFFSNGYYASMRTALKELGLDRDIDWFRYFSAYHGGLLSMKEHNDISDELKLFYEALLKQPLKVQFKTRLWIFLRCGKRVLKKLVTRKKSIPSDSSISGEAYGIKNILDLSQKLDANLIQTIKNDIGK